MLRLMLLRHAKSSWDAPGMADIDRKLSPRGRRDAMVMAEAMADRDLLPDLVLCSPAERTRETLEVMTPRLPAETAVSIAPELFDSPHGDYRVAIAEHGGRARRLLLIGHNPTIQSTALILTGAGDARLSTAIAAKYPTAGLAVIDFDIRSWADLAPHSGRIEAFITPKTAESGGNDGTDAD